MALDDRELKTVAFSVGIFALGATALILWQHAQHTKAIVATMGNAAPKSPGGIQGSASVLPSNPASLAGTPVIGQPSMSDAPSNVIPLVGGPNWSVGSGKTGVS